MLHHAHTSGAHGARLFSLLICAALVAPPEEPKKNSAPEFQKVALN
jgi:hypothetical protein